MNIREIILTPEAVKYKELAKRELFVLEAQRVTANQVAKRKVFQIEGVFALLYTSRMTKKIIMWGGRGPQIFLTNYTDAWAYDYYSDAVSNAAFAEAVATALPANPLYNGRNQVGDLIQSTYSQGWTSEIIGNPYLFLGGINNYELGVFHNGNSIYARAGDTIGHIATVPDTFLSEFAKPYGSLFGLPSHKIGGAWNQYRGVVLHLISPANQSMWEGWNWTPSFFTVEPADAYSLAPGFYYGKYPSSEYGIEPSDVLTSAKVSFRGIMGTRTKATTGAYNFGYCEVVTEINGVEKGDLNFFLGKYNMPYVSGNATQGYLKIAGTTADQTITVGSDLEGFDKTFSIALDKVGEQAKLIEVDFWNFDIWSTETDFTLPQTSGVCVALIDGTSAKFLRYSGYTSTICETTTYHSHSTSRDGTILAVFDSSDGVLITSVKVFDLYGTREPSDGAGYTSGGFTILRDSSTVASVEAVTGCVIPIREAGFEPFITQFDLATATPTTVNTSDENTFFLHTSALATIVFNKRADASPVIKKVVCDNGVDAEFGVSIDDCFASTMVVEHSYSPSTEKLVGTWDGGVPGGILEGKLRGDFVGSHPSMTFRGEGDGWYTSTKSPTFSILLHEDGTLSFEGYIGDLSIGSCIIEDPEGSGYIPDPDCADECSGGSFTMTASSSCGQTASVEVDTESPSPSPLTITFSGGESIGSGDFASGSGGVPPYNYSISCGIIDSITGEIDISGGGCCGSGTVTVTDACGASAPAEIRFPSGTWGPPTYEYCGNDSATFWLITTITSGSTKTSYYGAWYCSYQIGECDQNILNAGEPCSTYVYPKIRYGNSRWWIHQTGTQHWICP